MRAKRDATQQSSERKETKLTAIEVTRSRLSDEAFTNHASLAQHVIDTINYGHDLLRLGYQGTREKGS
jgi:hypothetical protein